MLYLGIKIIMFLCAVQSQRSLLARSVILIIFLLLIMTHVGGLKVCLLRVQVLVDEFVHAGYTTLHRAILEFEIRFMINIDYLKTFRE